MQGKSDKRIISGMGLLGQYLKGAFSGLAVGYCLALLLSRSVWLEMRVNIGHTIPIAVVCSVLFVGLKRRSITLASVLLLELLALFLLFVIYGFNTSTILTVPAGLFRDGFHLNTLSMSEINLLLACLLVMANIFLILDLTLVKTGRRDTSSRGTDEKYFN